MAKPFKVGDRVRLKGFGMLVGGPSAAVDGLKATVTHIFNVGTRLEVRVDAGRPYDVTVYSSQCTRLVKRKTVECWAVVDNGGTVVAWDRDRGVMRHTRGELDTDFPKTVPHRVALFREVKGTRK